MAHKKAKLSEGQIREIISLCEQRAENQRRTKGNGNSAVYREIGLQFGVSESHVRNIHRKRRRLRDEHDPQRTS